MDNIKVVHYVNQFFGHIGGEDQAGIPPTVIDGPVGVGKAIQQESGHHFEIVKTIICGDNYAAEHVDELVSYVLSLIKQVKPDLFVAGPAFAAGRYGIACGTLCKELAVKLHLPVVTAMHPLNPGVDIAKKYVYIFKAGDSARDMASAISGMIAIANKLLNKLQIGGPEEEGYIPRGIRINVRANKRGSRRAVDMMIKKLNGIPYETELPIPTFANVPPALPIENIKEAVVALVTEGGIVPKGNPDRIEAHNASKWCHYSIRGLEALGKGEYEVAHGGYDPVPATENPNRVLPLDAARQLEKEGAFRKLYDEYGVTVGNVTAVSSAERYGKEIGEWLKSQGVQGVILTST